VVTTVCRQSWQEMLRVGSRTVVAPPPSASAAYPGSSKGLSRLGPQEHHPFYRGLALPQALTRLRAKRAEPSGTDEVSCPRLQAQQAVKGDFLSAGYAGAPVRDADLLAETDMGTSNRALDEGNSICRKADEYRSSRNHALPIHRSVRHLSTSLQITRTPPRSAGFLVLVASPSQPSTASQTAAVVTSNPERMRSAKMSSFVLERRTQGKQATPLPSGVINYPGSVKPSPRVSLLRLLDPASWPQPVQYPSTGIPQNCRRRSSFLQDEDPRRYTGGAHLAICYNMLWIVLLIGGV
jgi:hypothetical protein